eukprot:442133_1
MIFFGGLLSSFFALFNFVRLTVVPPLDLVLLERGGSSSFGDSSSAFGVIFNSLCRLIAAACVNFIEFLLFFVVPYNASNNTYDSHRFDRYYRRIIFACGRVCR